MPGFGQSVDGRSQVLIGFPIQVEGFQINNGFLPNLEVAVEQITPTNPVVPAG